MMMFDIGSPWQEVQLLQESGKIIALQDSHFGISFSEKGKALASALIQSCIAYQTPNLVHYFS